MRHLLLYVIVIILMNCYYGHDAHFNGALGTPDCATPTVSSGGTNVEWTEWVTELEAVVL